MEILFGLNCLRKLRMCDEILVVYQMGKVGSKSLEVSLKRYIPYPIFHAHQIRTEHKNPAYQLLYEAIKLEKRKTKFITMVREPFARNESSFFTVLPRFYPKNSWKEASIQQLCDVYVKKFPHTEVALWFDWEFRNLTGINVYDGELISGDHMRGKKDNIEYLLLFCESSNERKEELVKDFLGLKELKIKNVNITEQKPYKAMYEEFKSHLRYPDPIFRLIKESQYNQFFYSDKN